MNGVQFDPDLVTFIDEPRSRDEVLHILVDQLYEKGKISNKAAFFDAIINRENIVSTGIGLGVAIPHAKLEEFDQFFVAVAVLPKKGVDWDSIDHAPVRVVFLIGGPVDRQTEYLQILSNITQTIKDEEVRNRLLHAHSPHSVLEHLLSLASK